MKLGMNGVSKIAQKAKMAAVCTLPAVYSGVASLTAYAAEGDSTSSITDITTNALTTALTGMANSVGSAVGTVIPIALPIVGCSVVVTIGLKIFKTLLNKA